MFGFLTPAALIGLGLLAIPVLLHLFKPRKVRQTPFSSLRWLRASQHRLSRRVNWHQILLLLLRMAFLTLLVLALAKPIFSLNRSTRRSERFVILDISRSMGYRSGTDPAPIEVGKKVAEQVLSSALAGDRTAVVLAGTRTRTLGSLVSDPSMYLTDLRAAAAEPGAADFAEAIELIRPMLHPSRSDTTVDLFFITDSQAQNWSQRAMANLLESIDQPVHVILVDVGPSVVDNAWVSDARYLESRAPMGRTIRVKAVGTGHEPQHRTVKLTGLPGLTDQTQQVELTAGNPVTVYFEIPAEYDLSGKVAELRLEPEDNLADDDTTWLNLDATASSVILVVEPQTTHIRELQPGFHLRTALEALSLASPGAMEIVQRSPADVLADELRRADAILLVDVPELSDSDLRVLEERIGAGAGLAVFLGPSVNRDFYNTRLHNPLRPASSLLPVRLADMVALADATPAEKRIAEIRWKHPLFRRLFDPVYGDLSRVHFQTFYRLDSAPELPQPAALAWIEGEVPAVLEAPFGAGKVILFNTTANDAWSDLPRRKSFVPLIDRLLDHLAGGSRHGTFTVGDAAAIPLASADARHPVSLKYPDGHEIDVEPQDVSGRFVINIDVLTQPGVYRVTYRGTSARQSSFPVVVQPNRAESALVRANEETLRTWWAPASVTTLRPDPREQSIRLAGSRLLLDPWIMVMAALVFLAEMVFVHRLCPRINPSVSRSVVARHGFFGKNPEQGEPHLEQQAP